MKKLINRTGHKGNWTFTLHFIYGFNLGFMITPNRHDTEHYILLGPFVLGLEIDKKKEKVRHQ